jgi:DNA replication protein DnaC
MMTHHFIDPKIYPNWKTSCHSDSQSAGCQFFYARYEELMKRIDFYNIYGPCLDGKTHLSQAGFIKLLAKKYSRL